MTEIRYGQATFQGSDATQRYQQSWHPENPKASVLIVHGYAEHSGRYADVAIHLAQQGFAVYTCDLLGHGHSAGDPGFVTSFSQYLTDLEIFLAAVRGESAQPLFLLGHSMGGTIAALLALQLEQQHRTLLQGLILSAPFLKVQLASLLIYPLSVLGQALPKLPTIRLDSDAISRDREIVQRYRTDPLVYHNRLPLQTVVAILRATQQIQARQMISLPLLILHGTADRLAAVEDSQRFYQQAQSPDKTLNRYQGLYHEVLNEPEKAQVLTDLTTWLNHRLR